MTKFWLCKGLAGLMRPRRKDNRNNIDSAKALHDWWGHEDKTTETILRQGERGENDCFHARPKIFDINCSPNDVARVYDQKYVSGSCSLFRASLYTGFAQQSRKLSNNSFLDFVSGATRTTPSFDCPRFGCGKVTRYALREALDFSSASSRKTPTTGLCASFVLQHKRLARGNDIARTLAVCAQRWVSLADHCSCQTCIYDYGYCVRIRTTTLILQ